MLALRTLGIANYLRGSNILSSFEMGHGMTCLVTGACVRDAAAVHTELVDAHRVLSARHKLTCILRSEALA